MAFHRRSNSARSVRCFATVTADQSRTPPACSIRVTSSNVKGRYVARQVQKSEANWPNGSTFCCAKEMQGNHNKAKNTRRIRLGAYHVGSFKPEIRRVGLNHYQASAARG